MTFKKLDMVQRIIGIWVYLGPSSVWPMDKHLQMRVSWWYGGIWIYLSP